MSTKDHNSKTLMSNSTVKSNLLALNSSLAKQLSNLTSSTDPSAYPISSTTSLYGRLNASSTTSVIDRVTTVSLANLTTTINPKEHIQINFSFTTLPTISIGKNFTNYTNLTSSLAMEQPDLKSSTSGLSLIFIGLLSIIVCAAIIFLVVVLIRKNRLDKLRHHLMPVYNFDPSEDGEDWETELLEEPFGSQSYGNESNKMTSIKLDSGLTGGLNIKSNGYTDGGTACKGRPTAASGLLSDNNNGNHSSRYLYTNEKPVV